MMRLNSLLIVQKSTESVGCDLVDDQKFVYYNPMIVTFQ